MTDEEYTGTVAPSDFDRDHIQDILCGYGDWFGADLLRLIAKADRQNREKIRQVYPVHVKVYEDWHDG